jgi:hypothetical protein
LVFSDDSPLKWEGLASLETEGITKPVPGYAPFGITKRGFLSEFHLRNSQGKKNKNLNNQLKNKVGSTNGVSKEMFKGCSKKN